MAEADVFPLMAAPFARAEIFLPIVSGLLLLPLNSTHSVSLGRRHSSRTMPARYSGFRAGIISSLYRIPQRSHRMGPSNARWPQVWPVPAVQTERSRTAAAFQPSTPGNHSRNCSMVAPSLRFSKRVDTGTRVPRNTQAPPSLSGCRSTAALLSQSVKS
jgi:hypothetical protein